MTRRLTEKSKKELIKLITEGIPKCISVIYDALNEDIYKELLIYFPNVLSIIISEYYPYDQYTLYCKCENKMFTNSLASDDRMSRSIQISSVSDTFYTGIIYYNLSTYSYNVTYVWPGELYKNQTQLVLDVIKSISN
jgi:hypothetical protein